MAEILRLISRPCSGALTQAPEIHSPVRQRSRCS